MTPVPTPLGNNVRTMQWAFDRGDERKERVRELADQVATVERDRAELLEAVRHLIRTSRDGYGHAGNPKCEGCRVVEHAEALIARLAAPPSTREGG